MKVAVYRTIFGEYNDLKPIPKQTVDFDYYCITDDINLMIPGCESIVPQYPRFDLHPRMRAKYFKMFWYEIPELAGYDVVIYIDGSINIVNSDFVDWCLRSLPADNDMLLFRHPQRKCIYEEFKACKQLNKYKHELQDIQMVHYKNFHPANLGLFACGVMIRRNTPIIHHLMNAWWHEVIKYSWQDQISFPVVCRLLDFKPAVFKENQYSNDYFQVLWHDDTPKKEKKKSNISVSVLMPVYKTPVEFLYLAIDSILTQTYEDFEFVIVDDNNTDEKLLSMLGEYYMEDKRIKIVRRNENKGIAAALNTGLEHCTGNLVIRMDSDDIARKILIEKQIEFFTNNPKAMICGVQIAIFGDKQKQTWTTSHPKIVKKIHAKNSPGFWICNHPGIAFKRDFILKMGGYGDIPPTKAEDWALWCKILKAGYNIYNQLDVLLYYRKIDKAERTDNVWKDFLVECQKSL